MDSDLYHVGRGIDPHSACSTPLLFAVLTLYITQEYPCMQLQSQLLSANSTLCIEQVI